ncbi:MAG: hypothetical protein UX54_C0027G0001, partial [Parcubacteria group bacterium GW2011_GWA2_46_39]
IIGDIVKPPTMFVVCGLVWFIWPYFNPAVAQLSSGD